MPQLRLPFTPGKARVCHIGRATHRSAAVPCHKALPRARSVAAGATVGEAEKLVWLSTSSQDVLTAALEAGISTVLFEDIQAGLASEWQQLGRFDAVRLDAAGRLLADGGIEIGRVHRLSSPDDLRAAEKEASGAQGMVVMDASDWQIIPAENLVAAYQRNAGATLLAAAPDAASARVMLEALEIGTDGVVLRTEDPLEVRALARYLQERAQQGAARLAFETARVTAVRPVGMGDRACVDLCSLLVPGEGLLVGSFARALFLVHSECAESRYIASRPFRVNAGPVHAYCQLPGGRTGYLSELRSGAEVLVAAPDGATRAALVGRAKIERRPLVLVEAELPDGDLCSVLLQNAETVRLVGPSSSTESDSSSRSGSRSKSSGSGSRLPEAQQSDPATDGYVWQEGSTSGSRGHDAGWRAVPVSELKAGDEVLVLRQGGARHTGVAIEESIVER